jgi:hypothetical protein
LSSMLCELITLNLMLSEPQGFQTFQRFQGVPKAWF